MARCKKPASLGLSAASAADELLRVRRWGQGWATLNGGAGRRLTWETEAQRYILIQILNFLSSDRPGIRAETELVARGQLSRQGGAGDERQTAGQMACWRPLAKSGDLGYAGTMPSTDALSCPPQRQDCSSSVGSRRPCWGIRCGQLPLCSCGMNVPPVCTFMGLSSTVFESGTKPQFLRRGALSIPWPC